MGNKQTKVEKIELKQYTIKAQNSYPIAKDLGENEIVFYIGKDNQLKAQWKSQKILYFGVIPSNKL